MPNLQSNTTFVPVFEQKAIEKLMQDGEILRVLEMCIFQSRIDNIITGEVSKQLVDYVYNLASHCKIEKKRGL